MGKRNSTLKPPDTMEDFKKETHFTEDEIKTYYKEFMEEHPEGKVDIEEFQSIYVKIFKQGNPGPFCENVFRAFDTSNDGLLDFREFLCLMSIISRGTLDQRLELAFSIYDLNDNGSISGDEMLEIVKCIFKMENDKGASESPRELVAKVFGLMDKNHDMKLTKKEFVRGCKNNISIAKRLAFIG